MLAYHAVAVEPEGAARELAGAGVGGEGEAVRQRGPHQVRVAEQRDVPVLVVRGDRRGVADDEDVGAVAVGLLLPAVTVALLGDERQDLLPEVEQDDLRRKKRSIMRGSDEVERQGQGQGQGRHFTWRSGTPLPSAVPTSSSQ